MSAEQDDTLDRIYDEQSPLLDNGKEAAESAGKPAGELASRLKRLMIVGACITLVFSFIIALTLLTTPLLHVSETIICDRIHPPTDSTSDRKLLCKDKEVQGEISILQGWGVVFGMLPGLVLSIPLGLVADKYGRTVVLGLSLLGVTLSQAFTVLICSYPETFPLRLTWLAPLFLLIGGGIMVTITMIYAIVADVSTEAEMAITLSYVNASVMAASVVGNPVTYAVMKLGLWVSIYSGLAILSLSTVASFFIPSTLKTSTVSTTTSPNDSEEIANGDGDGDDDKLLHRYMKSAKSGFKQFTTFVHLLITRERQVSLLLVSILLTTLGRDSVIIMMQYVTTKFKWEWSEAGLMQSMEEAINLVTLTVLVPFVSQQLLFRGVSPQAKDLWLIRTSGLLRAAGSFMVGLAPTPALLAAGTCVSSLSAGYMVHMRALMTSMMPHDIAMLYSVISLLETVGILIANPIMAASFRVGMDWGGSWIGLPFIIAGLLYITALVIIGGVKPNDGSRPSSRGSLE
ncbi:major facilitator superfamily domain-containing protein [Xylariales sp. PMI_506]|nr:major facilitator superfamily domain-containing protein [Xylariales sp. PMI_506]